MGFLAKMKNATPSLFLLATGKSLKVDLQGRGNSEDDAELYHVPGVYSIPIDDVNGVVIDVQENNIVIATHDYKLANNSIINTLDKGDIIIYSSNNLGVIQGSIIVNTSGEIVINEGLKSSVSYEFLNAALQGVMTQLNALFATKLDGGGTAGTATIDISASEVPEVKLP